MCEKRVEQYGNDVELWCGLNESYVWTYEYLSCGQFCTDFPCGGLPRGRQGIKVDGDNDDHYVPHKKDCNS